MSGRVFAAIDLGTTSISLLAAEVTEKGVRVLGSSSTASRGLRRGVVVNIDEAAHAIRAAISESESAAGTKLASAILGITGRHITGFSSRGLIGLRGREITAEDRERAIESARTVYMPLDRELLHVIPTEFVLDGQAGITDPVGMSGVRLESAVYMVAAHAPSVQNLTRACELAGLQVIDTVFGPVATAEAVLTPDEREQGVVLVDIGGGTTDIAFFRHGSLVHASVIGIGGLHITNDLAVGLKVSVAEAERIKKTAGLSSTRDLAGEEAIETAELDGQLKKVSRQLIAAVIQPRCEELFEQIATELKRSGAGDAAACSVVLTGGTALLNGITGIAGSILSMPVRMGLPHALPGMKHVVRAPSYAAVAGLARYAAQLQEEPTLLQAVTPGLLASLAQKIKHIFGYKDFLEIAQKKKKGVSYV